MKNAILATVLLALWASNAHSGYYEVGHVAAIKGTVEILRPPDRIKAKLGDKIFLLDVIEVKTAGAVKLLFNNDNVISLSENSAFRIKQYLGKKDATKKIKRSVFFLAAGKLRPS